MSSSATTAWRALVCLIAGLACSVVGMLPWLVHGAHLTLQNLWATPTVTPTDLPIVLLPFSQYQLDLVAAVFVIGSGLAGILARVLADRGVRYARTAIIFGVLAGQLVAVVQTVATVAQGLGYPPANAGYPGASIIYLAVMCTWLVLMIAIGVVCFVLLTRHSRAALVIGAGLAAVTLEAWVRGFVAPLSLAGIGQNDLWLFAAWWLPSAVVAAAIVFADIRSARAVIAPVAALLILWLGGATIAAIAGAAGSRALLRSPTELVRYFVLAFPAELQALAPAALVAAALAAVGLSMRWLITRRTAPVT